MVLLALSGCTSPGPSIQAVFPHKGDAGVPADVVIRISFDRAMDRASVESRVRIDPPIRGCSAVACPMAWDGSTLVLAHSGHELAAATHYHVRLLPGYRDATGLTAGAEHAFDFTVEDAPSLRSSTPAAGAVNVALDADLALQFSRRMLFPQTGELTLLPATPIRVGLDPQDQSRVVVSPLAPLAPGTAYRLVIAGTMGDATHNPLGKGYEVDYTTAARLDLRGTLGVAVREADGSLRQVVALRPGRLPDSPPPSLRVLYTSTVGIRDWGWSFDSSHLYVLDTAGAITAVDPLTGVGRDLITRAVSMAVSPARDEIAWVDGAGGLHLLAVPAAGDLPLPQAGRQAAAPVFSGDGRRLALTVAGGAAAEAPSLAILDRDTLSRYLVPGASVSPTSAPSWSADGFALAFDRVAAGGDEIWTYRPLDAAAPLERIGTFSPSTAAGLAWADDGGTIFAASASGIFEAPSRSLNGQNPGFALVTGSLPGDVAPATGGGDPRLAFIRPTAGTAQLWLTTSDGATLRQLSSADYDPDAGLATHGVDLPRWARP